MTQDVRQWLNEIRNLQNQLAEAHKERDQAYASATNWRNLYETEAKQRRTDANLARQQLEALQTELAQYRDRRHLTEYSNTPLAEIQSELEAISIEELRQRLVQALIECDRLAQALRTEQSNHAQTRNSLTMALGDAVDSLAQAKGQAPSQSPQSAPSNDAAESADEASKIPWLELPPLS
jgi:hypothetical protein